MNKDTIFVKAQINAERLACCRASQTEERTADGQHNVTATRRPHKQVEERRQQQELIHKRLLSYHKPDDGRGNRLVYVCT